jgi:hypothetical protein
MAHVPVKAFNACACVHYIKPVACAHDAMHESHLLGVIEHGTDALEHDEAQRLEAALGAVSVDLERAARAIAHAQRHVRRQRSHQQLRDALYTMSLSTTTCVRCKSLTFASSTIYLDINAR